MIFIFGQLTKKEHNTDQEPHSVVDSCIVCILLLLIGHHIARNTNAPERTLHIMGNAGLIRSNAEMTHLQHNLGETRCQQLVKEG